MSRGVLAFIGLGLAPGDISVRAIDFLKKCDVVFIEEYTSLIPGLDIRELSSLIGKPLKTLSRKDIENHNARALLSEVVKGKTVALLVPGDPFVATTHIWLRIEAEKMGIRTLVFNAPSIITAVFGVTGLQPYKFGRIVTIVYPQPEYGFYPIAPYYVLYDNLKRGLHTLFLLDLKLEDGIAMTAAEGAKLLLEMEEKEGKQIATESTLAIGLARVGTESCTVTVTTLGELAESDLGPPPHSIIIPGKLHPLEAEALIVLCGASREVVKAWIERLESELKST